jgi:hypothetical protein
VVKLLVSSRLRSALIPGTTSNITASGLGPPEVPLSRVGEFLFQTYLDGLGNNLEE